MSIDIRSGYVNRPKAAFEVIKDVTMTEKSGYMTTIQIVKDFERAGVNLRTVRSKLYDTFDPKVQLDIDPTRRVGFDIAEASMVLNDPEIQAALGAAIQRAKNRSQLGPKAEGSTSEAAPAVTPAK